MVDIHSHVLPGLDDGARTLGESVEMLKLAAASGTTDIVATPHANAEFAYDQQRVEDAFRELEQASDGIIGLHLACDFHLSYDNLHHLFRDPLKYTINGRGYLMVELPELVSLSSIRETLRQLASTQIKPVITHPERNMSLRPKPRELEGWVRDGCFVQVTGQSFLGRFGPESKRAADALMQADLVHFVASDAHDCVDRSPDLSEPYKYVSSRYGTRSADAVFTYNPTAALWGESITSAEAKRNKTSRLLSFWR
jgi:protein-tyrosine phosphatase